MKNTVRKITTVLLVLILTAGLIASAMADTVYITEGFTIPIGRIEGERPVTETPEPTPAAPEDELVDPIGNPEEPQVTDEQKPEEALDENVEGLVVVEGEEKTEDTSITEQTEVRINDATNENSLGIDMLDTILKSDKNIASNNDVQLIQIRKEPNGLSEILVEVPKETEFDFYERRGDWFLVMYEEIVGYVYALQMPGEELLVDENTEDNMKILIFTSQKSVVTEGETIHLTSILQGFEGYTIEYFWQWDRGNGWESIPDANNYDYYFIADAETLTYNWRLGVHYYEIDE